MKKLKLKPSDLAEPVTAEELTKLTVKPDDGSDLEEGGGEEGGEEDGGIGDEGIEGGGDAGTGDDDGTDDDGTDDDGTEDDGTDDGDDGDDDDDDDDDGDDDDDDDDDDDCGDDDDDDDDDSCSDGDDDDDDDDNLKKKVPQKPSQKTVKNQVKNIKAKMIRYMDSDGNCVCKDPCSSKDQAAGASASSLYNNSSVQLTINSGDLYSSSNDYEHGFLINDVSGNIETSAVQTSNSSTSLDFTGQDATTIGDLHTHPNDNYPPSVEDILSIAGGPGSNAPNLQTSLVITQNGTIYALVVTDRTLANEFFTNYKNDLAPNGYWEPNTTPYADYTAAYNSFISQSGATAEEATAYAQAYVLRNAGISLVTAAPGSGTLTKIGAENVNGTFSKADCPPAN